MIILRNKLYTSSISFNNEKGNLKGTNPGSWSESLNGFGNNPFPSSKVDPGNGSNSVPPMGELTQSARQTSRSANMLQKVMSDSPIGISYVRQGKRKKVDKSHVAKFINKHTSPILEKSQNFLQKVPIMPDSNKEKQEKKLKAIKFYIDRSTKQLNKFAEKIYSEERMPVSSADMRKAETDGVVQKRPDGKWGIIAKKKRLWWSAGYDSRESAEAALRAYHAGRH